MASGSFSLTEKLAVAGAFLALVAMAVGTEDDPGLVIAGPEQVKDLRVATPSRSAAPRATAEPGPPVPAPPLPSSDEADIPHATPMLLSRNHPDALHPDFDPDLGRIPRDFSNSPPDS